MTNYALYRLLEEMGKRPVLLDYSPLYGVKKFTEADGMSRLFLRRHSIGFTAPLEGDEAYDTHCECARALETPYVLSYVLEPDDAIQHHIAAISSERGAQAGNMVNAQMDIEEAQRHFGSGQIAQDVSPEQWVRNIRDCDFFITDSFHGVCYALMFNRPFLCVDPPVRGRTRFDSLLGLEGLQRCMLSPHYTEEEWNAAVAPIDWVQVNSILQREREKARAWLENALNTPRPAWRVALGDLVYEKLYAGFGEKERTPRREAEVRMYERDFLTHKLPRLLRMKRLWHRAWMYATIGRARARHATRLQELRVLARYLERRNSRPFR